MTWIDAIAPNIAKLAAQAEAHARSCTASTCDRCGKEPSQERLSPAEHSRRVWLAWAKPALKDLPIGPEGEPPAKMGDAWLHRLVGAPLVDRARRTLDTTRIAFLGHPGAGKTALAVAMFQAVLEAEPGSAFSRAPHRYVSAHALARARAGHPLGEGEAPLVADAFSCPLLVIDDLGSEDARFGTVVSEVIYERHARNRKTWITTGVRPADIAQRYGGGIVRRVLEWADRFDLQRGGAS